MPASICKRHCWSSFCIKTWRNLIGVSIFVLDLVSTIFDFFVQYFALEQIVIVRTTRVIDTCSAMTTLACKIRYSTRKNLL